MDMVNGIGIALWACGIIGFVAIAYLAGGLSALEAVQREAVRKGFAEYDSKTGLWKWKD